LQRKKRKQQQKKKQKKKQQQAAGPLRAGRTPDRQAALASVSFRGFRLQRLQTQHNRSPLHRHAKGLQRTGRPLTE
jgi:hypothetical protein